MSRPFRSAAFLFSVTFLLLVGGAMASPGLAQERVRVFVTASTIDESGFVSEANGNVAKMAGSVERWLVRRKKLNRWVVPVSHPQDADVIVTLRNRNWEWIPGSTSTTHTTYDDDDGSVTTYHDNDDLVLTTIVGTLAIGDYSTELVGEVSDEEFWSTAAKRFAFRLVDWVQTNHWQIMQERNVRLTPLGDSSPSRP